MDKRNNDFRNNIWVLPISDTAFHSKDLLHILPCTRFGNDYFIDNITENKEYLKVFFKPQTYKSLSY